MKSKQTAELDCQLCSPLLSQSRCGLWLTSSSTPLGIAGDFTSHSIKSTPIQLSGGLYICCSQTGRGEVWIEQQEGRWGECLYFGSTPQMYFGRRRACGEIWVEAETLGSLSWPGVIMVVLAITANARPVVQRFSSIITLMMDVTEVS